MLRPLEGLENDGRHRALWARALMPEVGIPIQAVLPDFTISSQPRAMVCVCLRKGARKYRPSIGKLCLLWLFTPSLYADEFGFSRLGRIDSRFGGDTHTAFRMNAFSAAIFDLCWDRGNS
jgi:hypothetical protein